MPNANGEFSYDELWGPRPSVLAAAVAPTPAPAPQPTVAPAGELSYEDIWGEAPVAAPAAVAPAAEEPMGMLSRMGKAFLDTMMNSTFAGQQADAAARNPYLNANPAVMDPGLAEQQLLTDPNADQYLEDQQALRGQVKAATERPAVGGVGDFVAELIGGLGGSVTSPENLLTLGMGGFGKTGAARIASEAGVNAAVSAPLDVAVRGARAANGQEEFSWGQVGIDTALAAALGGTFQGGAELLAKVAARAGKAAPDVTVGDAEAAAKIDPEVEAMLRQAGWTPAVESAADLTASPGNPTPDAVFNARTGQMEAPSPPDPTVAAGFADRLARRQAEDAARSNAPLDAVVSGDRVPRGSKDGRRPTPEEANVERARQTADGIAAGEVDPGADPRMGQTPRQSADPVIVDSLGRAAAPGDAGARAGLENIAGAPQRAAAPDAPDPEAAAAARVEAMSMDELDEILIRNGRSMAEVRAMPPGQKLKAARTYATDAARQPQGPTMSVRSEQPDAGRPEGQPSGSPEGSFSPIDRPAFSDQPNSARPNPDAADTSRAPGARPRESYATGGTGDRPFVADNGDPNARQFRDISEQEARRQQTEMGGSPPRPERGPTPEPDPQPEPDLGGPGRAQEPPKRAPEPPKRDMAVREDPPAREEPRVDPDAPDPEQPGARRYSREANTDEIMADFMRRRQREAEAKARAQREADAPPRGLGDDGAQARADAETKRAQDEADARRAQDEAFAGAKSQREEAGRGRAKEEPKQEQAKQEKAKAEEPKGEKAKDGPKGDRNFYDDFADESKAKADGYADAKRRAKTDWEREHAASWEDFHRKQEKRQRKSANEERAREAKRQEWRRKQDEDSEKWRQQRRERRERDDRRWSSGNPSDTKSSDPFFNKPTSNTAAPGADGRYATGTDGIVASDRGGPITFPDQKAGAIWVMKEGHKKSPDQIFELANHPTKGGAFTVRERGRGKANGGGPGATFYSTPVGPAARMLADALKWSAGKLGADVDGGIKWLGDFAGAIGRAARGGDKVKAILSVASAMRRTYDGHMTWTASHFKSPTLDKILAEFIATPGTGAGVKRTFDEAVQARMNPKLNEWGKLVKEIRETGVSDADIVAMLTGAKPVAGKAAKVVKQLAEFFDEQHAWATAQGVDLGKQKRYFPRLFDESKLKADQAGTTAKLAAAYRAEGLSTSKAKEAAENLWQAIVLGKAASPTMSGKALTAEASLFKSREFGPAADRILADLYVRDLDAIGTRYIPSLTRRAEVAARFGDGFAKWDDMIKAIRKEDASAAQIEDELASYVATSTGQNVQSMSAAARSAASWLRTITTLSLMEKATLSSLAEPILVGMRTGNLADSFDAFKNTAKQIAKSMRSASDAELREIVEDLGVIAGEGHTALMAARFNGGDELTRAQSDILSAYFSRTGLEQWTNATRVATARTGMVYLRRLAGDIAKGGEKERAARFYLRDLGVEDPAGFAKLVASWGDALPNHGQLFGAGEAAKAYRNAVLRFADQSILRPTSGSRPKWANHPLGALAFQLNGYAYAFGRNVIMRQVRMAQAARKGELPAGAYAQQLTTAMVPGFLSLMAAQYVVGEARDRIYGIFEEDPAYNRMTEGAKLERALSRTGLLAGYDPWFQMVAGSKYEANPFTPILGPALGRVGDAIDTVIDQSFNNTDKTNAAERKMGATIYDFLVEPTVNLALTGFGVGPATSAVTVGALPMLRTKFVDAWGGEKKGKARPIKGFMEQQLEKWRGPAEGGRPRRPERPERPERPARPERPERPARATPDV